ncbi:MAG: hypothetical protein KatS3mg107_0027 [Gemmataceae bacterium]|uniref:Zinc-finger domain-containing protein n=1 Tax=Thermogemmata fonticola TaxID=2755323 RepID=A0A7V9AAX0_9BACT|nr:hypothetical protein [Thermogemmata fonticola]MBA2225172.1 hypothetical protein [Thermogemmata fonticola]GIW84367.1 MAG: hypothetical protein KatS3mg107_0027 [Gemmataceae bacterium]
MISQWEDREPLPESGPCEAVIALLQECLDGEFPWERAEVLSLPHRQCCSHCRERWLAGRLLLTALHHPLTDFVSQTDSPAAAQIVLRARAVPHYRRRFRRWLAATAAALAAAVLLSIGMRMQLNNSTHSSPSPWAKTSVSASEENTHVEPAKPTLRVHETLSQAAGTVLESITDWAEPTWPRWPDPLPATPPSEPPPWGGLLLTSVRTGLEPVKDTTQKAVDCFLRDLAAWQPPSPKS